MLTGIVQEWCPKCTALSQNLDVHAIPHTPNHIETLRDEYGFDKHIIPFMSNFPCTNIYQMISPDLLHQVIKGIFKDNLVEWVCDYLKIWHSKSGAGVILDDINQWIAAVPLFPGLYRFPHGWDNSKMLMKVYLPVIVGYVPNDIVRIIKDFGAPGGLYSSITKFHHITTVKKLWHQLNRYQALGQMLLINHHLSSCGLFSHPGVPQFEAPQPQHTSTEEEDGKDDNGSPVEENVLGHVTLAQTCGSIQLSR
ncbi:hypothetical protein EDB89DRAFT_2116975 [Lactarius sanguifluus]|nr:hypothetical protein EDB89DRAFT_2116975 [Lactarius sanguifluus]